LAKSIVTTAKTVVPQWLLDFSCEHLIHELSMFFWLSSLLPGKGPDFETSVRLESWVIHLRNLIDFFYLPGRGDDVTARDFFERREDWTAPDGPFPNILDTAKTRANKELSHLTQARKSGNPPDKWWQVDVLLQEIEAIAKEFALKASDKKLHP
jgi:hypothetical protein